VVKRRSAKDSAGRPAVFEEIRARNRDKSRAEVEKDVAEAGAADYLVTGDRALLKLRTFRETRIVDPAMFTAIVDAARGSMRED